MEPCPSCGRPLETSVPGPSEHRSCAACGGRAYAMGRMRTAFPAPFFDRVREATGAGGWRGNRRCPLCPSRMVQFRVEHRGSIYALDFCDHCRIVWFDGGEHEAAMDLIPAPPPPIPVIDDPPSVRAYASPHQGEDYFEASDSFPGGVLDGIVAVSGLPRLVGDEVRSRPWASWILTGAIVAASLLAFAHGVEGALDEWGLLAASPFRHGGLTLVTSFFLHFGLWHLVSNAYFLAVFGPSVEDSLRPAKFLLLVALSAVTGKLLYAALMHGSPGISAGASGGISGVLAYWALAFPRARVRVSWFVWTRLSTFTMSSRMAFWCWAAMQILGGLLQVAGFAGVNHLAHLGGAAVGAAFWWFGPDGPRPAAPRSGPLRLSAPLRWEDEGDPAPGPTTPDPGAGGGR